jgi:hypothetical protein
MMMIIRGWFVLQILFSTWLLTPGLYISAPLRDSMIAGVVEVTGSVPAQDFDFAEISYSYQNENSANWFLISRIDTPIQDGVLSKWDTTTITDGIYRLQLRVVYTDGRSEEVVVNGLTVANYTHGQAIELAVPNSTATETPEIERLATAYPTPLAANPLILKTSQVKSSLITGVIFGFVLMGIIGFISYLNSISNRK